MVKRTDELPIGRTSFTAYSPAGWPVMPFAQRDAAPSEPATISFQADAALVARLKRHVAMLEQLAPGADWDLNSAALNLMLSALGKLERVRD